MKRHVKYLTTLVALLAMTVSTWATDRVTINVLPATQTTAPGTVEADIDGTTCTLTVTPSQGYMASLDNISVELVVSGDLAQTPRHSPDFINVTVTDLTPDADPSGETRYSFEFPDETYNAEVTVNFQTLIAIDPKVTLEGWTYGETANTPVVEGNLGNGAVTFTYATKGGTSFTSDVPTNAGNYTVKASIAASGQYAAGEATADFTISKATITEVTLENPSLTYTVEEQTVTIASVKAGDLELTADDYEVSGNTGTDKGTYTVTVTAKENSNFTGSKTATFTIGVKAVSVEMIADIADQTYTGSAITPTLTVKDGEKTLTLNTDYAVAYENNVNAGTATATITGMGNYGGTASKTFTIVKAAATITQAPTAIANLVYTGQAQALIIAGTAVGGELQYKLGTDGTYASSVPTATDVKTYIVYYKVVADANHTDVAEASVEVTIGKANLTDFKVTLEGWTYGETAKTPVVTGNLGNGVVTFTYSGENEDVFSETVPTDAGNHVVKAVVAETDSYFGTEATGNFTIAKAKAELWFDVDESKTISTPVNETPKWPALHNPQGLTISYNSSKPDVATIDASGNVKLNDVGTTTITASSKNNKNYLDIEDSYELVVTSYAYKLKIDGKVVTEENRHSVFDKSVIFDGKARLTLTNARISGIESGLDTLEIYLSGDNNTIMTEGEYAIKDLTPGGTQNLRILTDDKASLSLQSSEQMILGFDTITIVKPLEYLAGDGSELNAGGTTWAVIGVPLNPFVDAGDKNNGIDYQGNPGGVGNEDLTNIVIDNVLYTLHDTQTPGASDDGFYNGMVVLNSVVSDEDLKNALKLIPSTEEYAKAFKGLTIMVPPGSGNISIKFVTQEGHGLCLNFGGSNEIVLQTHGEMRADTIHYSCSVPTYVYIYHKVINGAVAASSHRIGPKPTVTTGVNGLSVSADNVDTPPGAQADYLSLSRDDIVIPEGGVGHIIVENEKVTDLDGDTFGSMFDNEDFAPSRRAFGNFDITYIDLRSTSITGKEFSREEGPFKGLPETTFIYLPAGNIVSGPNMVVGSVCDSLLLGNDSYSFECASGGFTATNAVLERPFAADEKKPFYVPFALNNPEDFGTFFEFDELKEGIVEMKKASAVAANTAYYLQAKEGGVENIEAQCVQVEPLEEEPYSGLIGIYMPMTLFSDSYVYDNALKAFRKGNMDYASPFEAYLSIYSTEDTLLTHWEGEPVPTAVEALRSEESDNDQWYSLDGRKLKERPTQKGVYLKGSKKLIVK